MTSRYIATRIAVEDGDDYTAAAIELMECTTCGALVVDEVRHADWHATTLAGAIDAHIAQGDMPRNEESALRLAASVVRHPGV